MNVWAPRWDQARLGALGTVSHLLSVFWPRNQLSAGQKQGPRSPRCPQMGGRPGQPSGPNAPSLELHRQAGVCGAFSPAFLFKNPPQNSQGNHQADKEKNALRFQGVDSPLAAMSAVPFQWHFVRKQTLEPSSTSLLFLRDLSSYTSPDLCAERVGWSHQLRRLCSCFVGFPLLCLHPEHFGTCCWEREKNIYF